MQRRSAQPDLPMNTRRRSAAPASAASAVDSRETIQPERNTAAAATSATKRKSNSTNRSAAGATVTQSSRRSPRAATATASGVNESSRRPRKAATTRNNNEAMNASSACSSSGASSSADTGRKRRRTHSGSSDEVQILSDGDDDLQIISETTCNGSSASASSSASHRPRKASRRKTQSGALEHKEKDNCPVCFECISTKGTPNGCAHEFCSSCILEWAKTCTKCPICRNSFSSVRKEWLVGNKAVTNIPVEERPRQQPFGGIELGMGVGFASIDGVEIGHLLFRLPIGDPAESNRAAIELILDSPVMPAQQEASLLGMLQASMFQARHRYNNDE